MRGACTVLSLKPACEVTRPPGRCTKICWLVAGFMTFPLVAGFMMILFPLRIAPGMSLMTLPVKEGRIMFVPLGAVTKVGFWIILRGVADDMVTVPGCMSLKTDWARTAGSWSGFFCCKIIIGFLSPA